MVESDNSEDRLTRIEQLLREILDRTRRLEQLSDEERQQVSAAADIALSLRKARRTVLQ